MVKCQKGRGMAVDSIVLAGDKKGARLVHETNKAFLKLRGRPLLSYVISALDRAKEVRSIHIVGPSEALKQLLSPFQYEKPIYYIEQGENVFQNIWFGSLHTFSEYVRGSDYRDLKSLPEADKIIFLATCDIPFLEPKEIDHFITRAPANDYDFILGITRKELLVPFAPKNSEPGISFAYFVFRDIIFRQSNVILLRPLKLGYVMEEFIPLVYGLRYQKQLKNIFKAIREIIRLGIGLKAMFYYLTLQSTRSLEGRGWKRTRDLVRRGVRLENVLAYIQPILQTRFTAFETNGPGPTLDTDNEMDLETAEKMFEKFKELQAQILSGTHPLSKEV